MSPFISSSRKVNASLASRFMAEILLLTATVLVVRPHPSRFVIWIISTRVGHFENLTKAGGGGGSRGELSPLRDSSHRFLGLPFPPNPCSGLSLCPLTQQKGRRRRPLPINHYSPYISRLVSMEMLLLPLHPVRLVGGARELQRRRFGPTAPSRAHGAPRRQERSCGCLIGTKNWGGFPPRGINQFSCTDEAAQTGKCHAAAAGAASEKGNGDAQTSPPPNPKIPNPPEGVLVPPSPLPTARLQRDPKIHLAKQLREQSPKIHS